MIAMARSIGHGGKYMDYMDGESKNKKHPEKSYFLQSHFLNRNLMEPLWRTLSRIVAVVIPE